MLLLGTMEKFQDRFFEEQRELLKRLGIKAILFDFDDTLIYTQELFIKYMDEYIEVVASETGLDRETVREDLERLNNEEYKKMGVNPERWRVVAERMALEREGYGESTTKNLPILGKIYTDEPRAKEGAKAVLQILGDIGVKMGMVTHANVDWTWRKMDKVKMIDFFDAIVIADENKHKGVEHWLSVIEELGVCPEECLVIGDSLGGDIIPTAKAGARTMWLHTGSSWSMYRTGEVPESTVHLDQINQVLSALEGLR
jgi:FMN phosphatase YigB (HAD superfamily)